MKEFVSNLLDLATVTIQLVALSAITGAALAIPIAAFVLVIRFAWWLT